jgi:predicted nucleotidyltransferase
MIDVEEEYLAEIRGILGEHVSDCQVLAFDSRVEGKAREFSDLDLALVGSGKVDWGRIERL